MSGRPRVHLRLLLVAGIVVGLLAACSSAEAPEEGSGPTQAVWGDARWNEASWGE